jgi:hypothetical protein
LQATPCTLHDPSGVGLAAGRTLPCCRSRVTCFPCYTYAISAVAFAISGILFAP